MATAAVGPEKAGVGGSTPSLATMLFDVLAKYIRSRFSQQLVSHWPVQRTLHSLQPLLDSQRLNAQRDPLTPAWDEPIAQNALVTCDRCEGFRIGGIVPQARVARRDAQDQQKLCAPESPVD